VSSTTAVTWQLLSSRRLRLAIDQLNFITPDSCIGIVLSFETPHQRPPFHGNRPIGTSLTIIMRSQLLRAATRSQQRLAADCHRTFSSTARRKAEVELTVDGKKVSIEAGSALIQACEKAGVTIPRYCYHEYVHAQLFHQHDTDGGLESS
jgi:hypothetical protein